MKLYHGSKIILEKPIVRGSKNFNDYGAAFYTTRDLESAHQWACRNEAVGYVNSYEFNERQLKVLDLTNKDQFSVLNWLAILMHYRDLDKGFIENNIQKLINWESHATVESVTNRIRKILKKETKDMPLVMLKGYTIENCPRDMKRFYQQEMEKIAEEEKKQGSSSGRRETIVKKRFW